MEAESIRLWIPVINLIATSATGIWIYLEKRNNKTNERIDGLAVRHEDLDKAMREVKSAMEQSLRHDDLSKVYDRLNAMNGKLSELIGEFKGNNDTLKLFLNKITERGLK